MNGLRFAITLLQNIVLIIKKAATGLSSRFFLRRGCGPIFLIKGKKRKITRVQAVPDQPGSG